MRLLKLIGFIFVLAANIIYVGNFHYSNYHCGLNDECFEIWNMNLNSMCFILIAFASIIPYKFYGTYTLFLNIILYCGYDAILRYHNIYNFHKYDVYAIILSPIFSSIFSLLFYNYVIKSTRANES